MANLVEIIISAVDGNASATMLRVGATAEAMGHTVGGVGQAFNKLADVSLVAGGAIAVGLGLAAKSAIEFDAGLAKVQNNTTMTNADVATMRETILGLSASSGTSLAALQTGFMKVQNITGDTAASTRILAVANESAVATGADAASTANILANAMHEYGLDAVKAADGTTNLAAVQENAARTMGILHLAAANGNMTLEEFSQASGRAIGVAANLGVPLEDVSSAFAALTKHGFDAAQAGTQMVNIMTHLINPTAAARKEIAALSNTTGVDLVGDFSAAGLHAKGLHGVLEDLQLAFQRAGISAGDQTAIMASLDGSLDEAKQKYLDMGMGEAQATQEAMKLINAQRGGIGLAALLGTAWGDYNKILQETSDTTLTAAITHQTFERQMQTTAAQVGIFKANLTILGVELGTVLLPQINNAVTGLTSLTKAFQDLDPGTQSAIVHVAEVAAGLLLLGGATVKAVSFVSGLVNAVRTVAPAFTFLRAAAVEAAPTILAVGAATVVAGAAATGMVYGLAAVGDKLDTTNQRQRETVRDWDAAAFAIAHGANETDGATAAFVRFLDQTNRQPQSVDAMAAAWNAFITTQSMAGLGTQHLTLALTAEQMALVPLNRYLGEGLIAGNKFNDTVGALAAGARTLAATLPVMGSQMGAATAAIENATDASMKLDAAQYHRVDAMTAALVATDAARNADENYGEGLRELHKQIADASDAFDAITKQQKAASDTAAAYGAQAKLLETGMDALNVAYLRGIPLSAAQQDQYRQASQAAAFYTVASDGLAQSQLALAIAGQKQVAAGLEAVHQAALYTGASTALADSLRGQAAGYLDLVAAVERANSAFRAAKQEHDILGGTISDFTGRLKDLDQIEKDYTDHKKGATALTAAEIAQRSQLLGMMPGLEQAYRLQAVQVTNLEIAQVLANAAVEESRRTFQAQNGALVAQGTALADAALKAGNLTQAQRDLAVSAITSASNAFDLTNAINAIPGSHSTTFTTNALSQIEVVDRYKVHIFDVPLAYQTKLQNNSSDLIPLVDQYGQAFIHVPADWVTHLNNNAGEMTPVVDQYGRIVAQIPKEWATTFTHNAGEVIPVVDEYGNVIKAVERSHLTEFMANTQGAILDVDAVGTAIIRIPSSFTVTAHVDLSQALAAISDLDAHMPHSPAKKGPFSTLPNWAALFETWGPALADAIAAFESFGNEAAKQGAETASSVAKAVTDILGAFGALAKYDFTGGTPSGEQLGLFTALTSALVRSLQDAAADFTDKGLKAASDFADAAGKVGSSVKNAVAGLTDLAQWDATKFSPTGDQMGWFRHLIESLVATFAEAATLFQGDALKAASDFADAAGKVGGSVKNAVEGLHALAAADWADSSPTGSAMGWFAHLVASLVENFRREAAAFQDGGLKAAGDFADAAGKVMGVIGPAVTGLSALSTLVAPPEGAADLLLEGIRHIVGKFGEMATTLSTEGVKHLGEFATAAGQALGAAKAGIDLFKDFDKLVIPSRQAIDNLYEGIKYIVQRFDQTAQELNDKGIAKMQAFAKAAQDCLTAAKSGTDLFKGFEKLVIPSKEAIDNLLTGIKYVVQQMGATADEIGREGLAKAQAFATSAAAVFAAAKSALDTLTDIAKYKDGPKDALAKLQPALQEAISQMLDREKQATVLKESAQRFDTQMGLAKTALEHGLSQMGMNIPDVPATTTNPATGGDWFPSGGGPIEARAEGGPVSAGSPYWVGDGGEPELFIPKQGGTIVPQSRLPQGGGGGDTIIINVGGSVVSERELVEVVHTGLLRKKRGNASLGLS